MTVALERLAALMPPPPDPPVPPPWHQAPAQVGFEFPADYRAFIDRYGAGEINGELMVLAPTERPYRPGGPGGFRGYTAFAQDEVGAAFTALRDADPSHNPFPLYPEPGGLLVWGRTYNGDHLFWHTQDPNPDRWTVVAWLRNLPSPAWRPFDDTALDFLLAVASHTHPHASILIGSPARGVRWVRTEDWTRVSNPPPER